MAKKLTVRRGDQIHAPCPISSTCTYRCRVGNVSKVAGSAVTVNWCGGRTTTIARARIHTDEKRRTGYLLG